MGREVLASEIADLNADIAKNNKAMASLTSIREKENSDYQQEKAFTETALSSLHAAIEVGAKNRSAYDRRTCSAASVRREQKHEKAYVAVSNFSCANSFLYTEATEIADHILDTQAFRVSSLLALKRQRQPTDHASILG